MAKKEKEKKPVLNFDDKDYVIDHINDLQNKMNTNQFMADQLTVGKEAFIGMLRESLNKEEEAE